MNSQGRAGASVRIGLNRDTTAGDGGFSAFIRPIATPFSAGEPDFVSLRKMLDDLAPHVQGVVAGGSVGETARLTLEARW